MTIEPDPKDWTWVLGEPCPDCRYDAADVTRDAIAHRIRANALAWQSVLAGPDDSVRARPAPATWSPLEYACHVRDVHRIFGQRLALMLAEDDPTFPNWDQDVTAIEQRYGDQDPVVVAAELEGAATVVADRYESATCTEWDRTGQRSDGSTFTVESLGRYHLHDVEHHLHDVRP